MAQRNRTIPDGDSRIVYWVRNFAHLISLDPQAYDLTQADADLLSSLAEELTAKYNTAVMPQTRTSPAIRAKNDCRKMTLAVFRSYVRQVNANPEIAEHKKVELGIVIPERRLTPIPAPVRAPSLRIKLEKPGVHKLGFRDLETKTGRRKPHGVSHLVLVGAIGDRPTNDPYKARYLGSYTRWPIYITHEHKDHGKCATYFAAWVTGTGKQTTWSAGVTMPIVFGGGAAIPTVGRGAFEPALSRAA